MTPFREWVDAHAVGFETVSFMIVGDAQWAPDANVIEQRIPGGNLTITQFLGLGPWKVDYEIWVASVAEFTELMGLLGTAGTLTVFGDTAAIPGTSEVIAGRVYDRIENVILKAVSPPKFKRDRVTCTATFISSVS